MSDIILSVTRGDPQVGQFVQTYLVPYREGMSLLDALLWVREHQDPTLVVRYSCRTANACKECSASIDSKAGYLCSTRARTDTEVVLAPLTGRQWICDLVTELD